MNLIENIKNFVKKEKLDGVQSIFQKDLLPR